TVYEKKIMRSIGKNNFYASLFFVVLLIENNNITNRTDYNTVKTPWRKFPIPSYFLPFLFTFYEEIL
ncbi:MAG: hypothetical protein ACK6DA_03105, partial [Candidatus Kapaibacterium sp.]